MIEVWAGTVLAQALNCDQPGRVLWTPGRAPGGSQFQLRMTGIRRYALASSRIDRKPYASIVKNLTDLI